METKQLKEFEVPERISIKKFVEGIGFDFVKGNAFYQLTKKETIQDYKNIVAKRKSDNDLQTIIGRFHKDLLNCNCIF